MLAIGPAEFEQRSSALVERLRERSLAGAVLFDAAYYPRDLDSLAIDA
jgi:hypothetical protein